MDDFRKDMMSLMLGSLALSKGGDPNIGQAFPMDDGADFARGARWIPGSVTLARRRGERVVFHTDCTQSCWYWEFPNGDRIQHYNSFSSENAEKNENGACVNCGNIHFSGGIFLAPEVGKLASSPHRHEFSVLHEALNGDEKALENLKTNNPESHEQILKLRAELSPAEIEKITKPPMQVFDGFGVRHYCEHNGPYEYVMSMNDGKVEKRKKKKKP